MDRWVKSYAPLFGRILVGGFFLWNGIQQALNLPAATEIFIALGLPNPVLFATLATAVEVGGGIGLILGFRTRMCAALLAFYVMLASGSFFNTNTAAGMQLFLQNMAILGGLLYITAYGSGKWSTDRRL